MTRSAPPDAEGNFDEYKNSVQKSMEKPYPENGGFYGIGALREMGLRKSRHSGDWRTKSEFRNKEEEFSQPLKGHDTVLEKGITIRGAGGQRLPSTKTGDGAGGAYQEPSGGKASTAQNVALIRSLAQSLALPQSVAARRTFEEVSVLCCESRTAVSNASRGIIFRLPRALCWRCPHWSCPQILDSLNAERACRFVLCPGARGASQTERLPGVGGPVRVQDVSLIHNSVPCIYIWAGALGVNHGESGSEQ